MSTSIGISSLPVTIHAGLELGRMGRHSAREGKEKPYPTSALLHRQLHQVSCGVVPFYGECKVGEHLGEQIVSQILWLFYHHLGEDVARAASGRWILLAGVPNRQPRPGKLRRISALLQLRPLNLCAGLHSREGVIIQIYVVSYGDVS